MYVEGFLFFGIYVEGFHIFSMSKVLIHKIFKYFFLKKNYEG